MRIRTFLSIALIVISGTGFSQVPDSLSAVYSVINAVFPAASKTKLLDTPLAFSRLNEDLLQELVKLNKISGEEKAFILRQTQQTPFKKWDEARLPGVKTFRLSPSGSYSTGSYGVAVPVFSRNGKLAIIYVHYLASDMVHTQILVYELVNGKWQYTQSLLSEMS
ncbi:hypothetical protein KK083_00555 [Fulvivirgaceae bacterium PWU4]|uniref:Uncharacterized protein n=1 Tax=Chryseosolibacter histidini TaxID=2782349 RepID=A0AAP2DF40_9BACT|nr:hypothetical protein [Chryseosolibacter histidini]MBT1695343.1 hypothetical protein [Chryseosolibacter histidini]